MLLADRYDDRTHFIFELLQNAEDALGKRGALNGPRRFTFDLSPGSLALSHFGRPFDEADVRSVCGIAQSTIGRFGIGFKSVYTFTDRPTVTSRHHRRKWRERKIYANSSAPSRSHGCSARKSRRGSLEVKSMTARLRTAQWAFPGCSSTVRASSAPRTGSILLSTQPTPDGFEFFEFRIRLHTLGRSRLIAAGLREYSDSEPALIEKVRARKQADADYQARLATPDAVSESSSPSRSSMMSSGARG